MLRRDRGGRGLGQRGGAQRQSLHPDADSGRGKDQQRQHRDEGAVSFEDLSGTGRTTINGANVNTGIVSNAAGTTEYNLDNGTIRMGGSSGNRVYIDSDKIEWYGGNASGGGTGAGIIEMA